MMRCKFFVPFVPGTSIKRFRIPFYKVMALNVGEAPGKPILLNNLDTDQKGFVSYHEIENKFYDTRNIETLYQQLGFSCEKHDTYAILNKTIH